jgi:hypothetical protein
MLEGEKRLAQRWTLWGHLALQINLKCIGYGKIQCLQMGNQTTTRSEPCSSRGIN